MDFWASFWDFVGFFFWTMVLVSYLYVLFAVIADVFRDREMSGWGKAGWLILMLFVPVLTMLVYIVARGPGMAERQMRSSEQARASTEQYIRNVASSSPAQEISQAKTLLDSGAISASEFEAIKSRALGGVQAGRVTD
ncbi:SHOCT domain-containing protein [Cryobacterium tagatosivorans]|uniref:Cardiolipin synthase N-terminal domain-containing protein n=1 Tax=Cryobacterium tagatosivorans TaxID=1259199 RepID=A0A4R8UBL4_9MICO|nr:SHOCT domain-containing protein [Cryobacterium tagatosivorans]TFB48407.1 hypothetical protein E3O23_13635 [Cryobacterium tagatosivorans]